MTTHLSPGRRIRAGGRAARLALREAAPERDRRPVWAGIEGGRYNPLSQADVLAIHRAALDLLGTVGIGQATADVIALATAQGCHVNS
ncbi:MAG: trimethylamine methyltransferase family protein, partial [Rhodobacteraceae bacterium]|nr:trimethylamine methyltransferase family protein [Paracoccaceae bacterium]